MFGGYTRSISFSLDIVNKEEDIPIIWEKINYAKIKHTHNINNFLVKRM